MDADENYLPLWLELHSENDSWLFELQAGEDRAVVVGSHPTSDVRVARDGVAATHFHFEREGDGVVIVPGYRAALVVDHVPAAEPIAIAKQACLEFRGAVIDATVHDVPPLHLLLQARHGTERTIRRPDYFDALPGDSDPTFIGLEAVAARAATAVQSEPGSEQTEDELDLMATTAWRPATEATLLGPQGTVIMKLPQTEQPAVRDARKELATSPHISSTEPVRLEARRTSAFDTPEASPTRTEVPRPHKRPSLSTHPGALPPPAPQVHGHADRSTSPSLVPTARAVSHAHGPSSVLAQVGWAASNHPWRVAAAALPVCAFVALAFVGVARLASVSAGRSTIALAQSASSQWSIAKTSLSASSDAQKIAAPAPWSGDGASVSAIPASSAAVTAPSAPTLGDSLRIGVQPHRPPSKVQHDRRSQKHVFLGK